ncbi:hypothetical protein TWF696_004449 [Orbilia brochopaga]|uniref:Dienelactone hydrolase domain-containing protein n=1 Tax=Orbilia brochopaga TaxID=3140254 RepID=A0AAV9V8Y7_9PEZI
MSRFVVSRGIRFRPASRIQLSLCLRRGSNICPSTRQPPSVLAVDSISPQRPQSPLISFSRNFQNIAAMDRICEACKTIPPIVAEGYEKKGVDEDIGGVKCYVAAPQPTPKTGIIFVYDIFGYYPQTLQGADILALTDPGHVVIMPDFFNGQPMDLNFFPPDTDEKKAKWKSFFEIDAAIPRTTETAYKVLAGVKEKFPEVTTWGMFGLCWGGKAATVIAKDPKNVIQAAGQAHPAMLDAADYENYPLPQLTLFSKDEDPQVAQKVSETLEALGKGSVTKTYPNDIHGWMGARANLKNPAEAKSYEQGYTDVVEFFKKTLS